MSGVAGILTVGSEYVHYLIYESTFEYSGLNVILQLCAHATLVTVFLVYIRRFKGGSNEGT